MSPTIKLTEGDDGWCVIFHLLRAARDTVVAVPQGRDLGTPSFCCLRR